MNISDTFRSRRERKQKRIQKIRTNNGFVYTARDLFSNMKNFHCENYIRVWFDDGTFADVKYLDELSRDLCEQTIEVKIDGEWEFFRRGGAPKFKYKKAIIGYKEIEK